MSTRSPADGHVDLTLTGMTCASCAARIEKRLNRLDGVSATVNFATEKAAVDFDPGRCRRPTSWWPPSRPSATAPSCPQPPGRPAPAASRSDERTPSRPSWPLCASGWSSRLALTVPVLLMAMVPALQFTNWQWLSLTLAAPVATWGAWPFHRAAWANLRHGAATMDTLISVGVLAAFGWSLWALFFGDAGTPGMTMPFSLTLSDGRAAATSSTSRWRRPSPC